VNFVVSGAGLLKEPKIPSVLFLAAAAANPQGEFPESAAAAATVLGAMELMDAAGKLATGAGVVLTGLGLCRLGKA
jgi:hypothetical protein